MKDAVWLACCPRNERRIVQREIESREVGARLLWLDGVQALGEVLAALSEPVDGVVVLDDEGMRDKLLALLAKVASSQVPCRRYGFRARSSVDRPAISRGRSGGCACFEGRDAARMR